MLSPTVSIAYLLTAIWYGTHRVYHAHGPGVKKGIIII